MFHSVGLYDHQWRSPYISSPLQLFEEQIKALCGLGYTGIFFKDIATADSQKKNVSLTFDDGYLDNWVHVFPILEKYGMRGTIFVSPDFVDPSGAVRRKNAGGIDDKKHIATNCCAGFLSWQEMREMEKSGLIDIQSHALTHTWYFAGPDIVDFWHPGSATEHNGPVWMLWNRFPELKPYYITRAGDYENKIAYGTPIHAHGKSLATRQYFPDMNNDSRFTAMVKQCGGVSFFEKPDWRDRLLSLASEAGLKTSGAYESDDQYVARIRHELSESRRLIQENLQKKVTCLCWPGGGVSEQVVALARECGYKQFTLPSAWRADHSRGKYKDLIPRMGSGTIVKWGQKDIGIRTSTEFKWRIKAFNGSGLHSVLLSVGAAGRLALFFLGFNRKKPGAYRQTR